MASHLPGHHKKHKFKKAKKEKKENPQNLPGLADGQRGKDTCSQVWPSAFDPQKSHGGKREETPTNCLDISTLAMVYPYPPHNNNIILNLSVLIWETLEIRERKRKLDNFWANLVYRHALCPCFLCSLKVRCMSSPAGSVTYSVAQQLADTLNLLPTLKLHRTWLGYQ